MEETRRKIIEATASLHAEKGVVATSYKDIATRADVGVGTVYYHFPTYDEVVKACGAYTFDYLQFPKPEIFEGITSLDRRVERLVEELFALCERYGAFGLIRSERASMPVLDEGLKIMEQALENTVRAAFNPVDYPDKEKLVQTVIAFTDFAVYQKLTSSGLSTQAAARRTSEVLLAWLQSLNLISDK
jgi:AcrR family transcriptional regulator